MRRGFALFLCASCTKSTPPAPVVPPDTGAPVASASASAGPIKIANAEEKKRFSDYNAALGRGRKATIAKKYADALKAFDEALAIRPGDDRALGEKGYAEFLSGDLRHASRDLEAASNARDPNLASQIWFNLGLVHEADKATEAALIDFWFADQLHPSLAAQTKIGGRSVCPVQIDRVRKPGVHATSWRDVARILSTEEHACKMPASTEAEAKDSLLKTFTGEPATSSVQISGASEFYLVRSGPLGAYPEMCPASTLHVLEVAKSDFWIYPSGASGYVEWDRPIGEVETVEPVGGFIVGRRVQAVPMDVSFCSVDGGEERECTGDPDEVFSSSMRLGKISLPVYTDDIIDASTHTQVLSLTDAASQRFGDRADGGRATTLRGVGPGLELVGLGCNLQFSRGDGGL
jgi:hypothetical protein